MEQMVRTLLEGQQSLLERVTRMEAKLDGLAAIERRVERIEGRVDVLERAPGGRWNALAQAILTAIGMAIGGGILAAVVFFIKS